jgi:hypothetical protein
MSQTMSYKIVKVKRVAPTLEKTQTLLLPNQITVSSLTSTDQNGNHVETGSRLKLGHAERGSGHLRQVFDLTVGNYHNFFVRGNSGPILVSNCHQLTPAAQQALLKPLEEPPEQTVWLLGSMEAGKIDKAVRNRCQEFKLAPVEDEEMRTHLGKILRREKINLEDETKEILIDTVVGAANGITRKALQLLDSGLQLGNLDVKSLQKWQRQLESVLEPDKKLAEAVAMMLVAMYTGRPKMLVQGATMIPDGEYIPAIQRAVSFNQAFIDQLMGIEDAPDMAAWMRPEQKKFLDFVSKHTSNIQPGALLQRVLRSGHVFIQLRERLLTSEFPKRQVIIADLGEAISRWPLPQVSQDKPETKPSRSRTKR